MSEFLIPALRVQAFWVGWLPGDPAFLYHCGIGFSRDALLVLNPKVPGGVVAGDHFESPPEIVFVKMIPGNHLRAPATN